MWDSKLFKTGIAILVIFAILYIGTQISFVFRPIVVVFEALFLSFIIAGILFYFTVPLSDFLCKYKLPRFLSILIVFVVIAGVVLIFGLSIGPILVDEFARLINSLPQNIRQLHTLLLGLREHPVIGRLIYLEAINMSKITEWLAGLASNTIVGLTSSLGSIAGVIGNFFTTIMVVPFLLFFMLKEKGQGSLEKLVDRFVPEDYQGSIKRALAEINVNLGEYFKGVGIVCFCVGALAYISFLIIGLEFALILAIIIGITNIIPYLGPFIGAIPAALIALFDSPTKMLYVIIAIVIVQQIESLFISPAVMGRKLALNPLVVILVILIAGRLAGLLGIILAVPSFTVLKIVVSHTYEHIQQKKQKLEEAKIS
jgi:predicted PurR-regulated permease PerM